MFFIHTIIYDDLIIESLFISMFHVYNVLLKCWFLLSVVSFHLHLTFISLPRYSWNTAKLALNIDQSINFYSVMVMVFNATFNNINNINLSISRLKHYNILILYGFFYDFLLLVYNSNIKSFTFVLAHV